MMNHPDAFFKDFTLSFNSQVCVLDSGFGGTCPLWLGGPSQAFISSHYSLCSVYCYRD